MSKNKKELHVISHTHWDREWYYTLQQFQVKLVDLIDNLLDILDNDPSFKFFNMDCQTIVLEDYLAVKPQNEAKLKKYIKEGKIVIGPWYQLNDENLVSGESTIRSLLIGHEIAESFGGTSKCGYLPDQFGNVSQMPQIFLGFGIDTTIMGRGFNSAEIHGENKSMEFMWEGADGSKVLASAMAFWYNNAQHFPEDTEEAVTYTDGLCKLMMPRSAVGHLLLMNGVDHLEPQHNVGQIIDKVNPKLKDTVLVHSTLDNYISAIKKEIEENKIKLRVYSDKELRYDNGSMVLAGTLTARTYLKQSNNACEQLLEKTAEPINAFNMMTGGKYYDDFLKLSWKTLMKNHPHDSICGCSIDQVHREMEVRFEQVDQWANTITQKASAEFVEKIKTDDTSLVVFNTLSWDRTEKITADLYYQLNDAVRGVPLPADPARDVTAFKIVDPEGAEVPFFVKEMELIVNDVVSPVELPLSARFRHYVIEFVASEVPAFGYKTFTIVPTASFPKFKESLASRMYEKNAVSNDLVSVKLDEGKIVIKDLILDKSIENAGLIEESGCVGDEYNYRKPINDQIFTSAGCITNTSVIDHSPVSATLVVEYDMKVPATTEDSGRSEELVSCPVKVAYTVNAGSPRVDMKIDIENNAKNHRFRAVFPTEIKTDSVFAEMPLDVIKRDKRRPAEWNNHNEGCAQKTFMSVSGKKEGVTLINKGLAEYEVYDDCDTTAAVTLLRGTPVLAKGDEVAATFLTPAAQCLGKNSAEIALYMHEGDYAKGKAWEEAHGFNSPMYYTQTDAHEGSLPKINNFIAISDDRAVFSALKKAERKQAVILRLYNPTEEELKDVEVKFFEPCSEVNLVNLNEEVVEKLKVKDGVAKIDMGAKKIITLEFVLKNPYKKPYPPIYRSTFR